MIRTHNIKRRNILQALVIILYAPVAPLLILPRAFANSHLEPLNKSHIAWRTQLSPEAYQVLFEHHTEEPNSSELNHEHREGTFICAACYLPLFQSQHKYESGSGWPSFTQPLHAMLALNRIINSALYALNITASVATDIRATFLTMGRFQPSNAGATTD